MKDEKTEDHILNAAERVFQRKGMDGARMQEIANEAGINKAMLHYYYRSKRFLFEAVFTKAFSLIAPEINKVVNDDTDLFEKIRDFTYSYISFTQKHPYLPNFIIQELNRDSDFINVLQTKKGFPDFRKFQAQVEKEVRDGKIRSIKAEQLFIHLLSLNIFPFLAAPLIKGFLKINDRTYKQLMEERKEEISNILINHIKVKE
ncbi:MAG: TetR/AcrR family transcriptional regulator [Salegentibacter sp.]|uniref:Transcriptional regulator, TetR family n=1 Tax=Salegentibacter flavus TaxID=287099 RepID=A0A1I5D6E4_9FLAO|nr:MULTISPECIES: TetR/AcrR family transcriptional regulator [Salegentibacter]MDR9457620.1 TetR/AcrR family transcriptional regulator [Salegentibacter sp.]SFN94763.1 transcriptional regulator, TetR family [Salegentibacter flavus]